MLFPSRPNQLSLEAQAQESPTLDLPPLGTNSNFILFRFHLRQGMNYSVWSHSQRLSLEYNSQHLAARPPDSFTKGPAASLRGKSFKACWLHTPLESPKGLTDWEGGRHCKGYFCSHFSWSSPPVTFTLFYCFKLKLGWCILLSGVLQKDLTFAYIMKYYEVTTTLTLLTICPHQKWAHY